MKDKNGLIGFILLGILMLAYFWISNNQYQQQMEEQRIQDSIAQAEAALVPTPIDDTLDIASTTTSTTSNTILPAETDSLNNLRMMIKYGDFATSANGEDKEIVLENSKAVFTFSTKGGRIKSVRLKDYQKSQWNEEKEKVLSDLYLLEDDKNKFDYKINVNGVATPISTEDLYFTPIEQTGGKVVFRAYAGNGTDKYFEQSYTLNEDYILDYDIKMVGLESVLQGNTEYVELEWVNYLDKLERAVDYERNYTTVYHKYKDKSPTYCSCRGDDEIKKDRATEWVSHSNQFFNTSIIADSDKAFSYVANETKMMDMENEDLKRLGTTLHLPISNNGFGMRIYSGPNEFKRLAAFENDLDEIIPFGRSILGTINRWVIRPLFSFFSSFLGSMGLCIILVTFLVKMLLYPLTYKMLYSQAKMSAMKPKLEELKKKIGDDAQALQVEQMKLYRQNGVNPLGGCMPMVLQMPIWIALYRFFPAAIEFRQASFLWADDLASYDVFTWLPFHIPMYGAHISLFTILWAITTLIYTYYNSKHLDMSANPSMKYMQYFMPFMFLFFFNSLAAGLTCYMFFSNMMNIAQTIVTKNFIIDKKKVLAELEQFKAKPKKKGGFQERLQKAFEEAQAAQEQRQRETAKKKKK